ncbi:hypothetical protein [Pseudarthrobacter sp. NIBRBAC000502770]|uniref:hypothetical protein n=1 Tax=Pseudarthrobacter sp. NIBRBAC000502770 TaxID=2590785 RepID=UPI001FEEF54A|nr:hypothetical protein [Pseudarthrobacter sp. NIBRBAC000502770]
MLPSLTTALSTAGVSTAALTAATQVPADTVVYGPWHGAFSPWFLLFPLFWILVIALFIFVARRTWRRNQHWAAGQGAEGVLRERYARGRWTRPSTGNGWRSSAAGTDGRSDRTRRS